MDKDDLWVIFKVADNMYAVNSGCIEGIGMVPEQVTAVPEAEPWIRGIVKQRGKIVTLIDLWKVFGLKEIEREAIPGEDSHTMMIMMRLKDDQSLALIVDEIVGVEQIGEIYHNTAVDKISRSELVGGVASTLDGNNLLLLIDEKQINLMLVSTNVLDEPKFDIGLTELS
ncbi:chemotaxis protein CheW [Lachnospiraceae bacterium 54-53]